MITDARAEHIPLILEHVRDADREELWSLYMMTPEQVLRQSFDQSCMCWTGLMDGDPVCMFGVTRASVLVNTGIPWLIGTDLLERHQIAFLRKSKICVDVMLSIFGKLENCVDVRNTRAVLWLKWLGFTFSEPEPLGPFQMPFMKFSMEE
jgi:hypothetical protein